MFRVALLAAAMAACTNASSGEGEGESSAEGEGEVAEGEGEGPAEGEGDSDPGEGEGEGEGEWVGEGEGEPHVPVTIGPMTTTTNADAFEFDLLAPAGHRIWVDVSSEQRQKMNEGRFGGGGGGFGDIYTPGGGGGDGGPFADHVVVEEFGSDRVADFGKIEVKLVGESTFRPFDEQNIPNLRFDADEFQPDLRIGGYEHFRLNNALVGTIFREVMAHRVYKAMGYPALRSSYAMLGSNVWGNDTWIPMVLMEVYKPSWCADNLEDLGGDCVNLYEFPGDVGQGVGGQEICQSADCDVAPLQALTQVIQAAPQGAGFKAATAELIDWEAMHRFQCMSWIMWAGDDMLHNSNNNMIAHREDGKFVWMPYSVDITAGGAADWGYVNIPLDGNSTIPRNCQADPDCYRDLLSTCALMIEQFDALNPELMVDEVAQTLESLGMMREGDDARYQEVRDWYSYRQTDLYTEIQQYQPCAVGEFRCNDRSCQVSQDICDQPEHLCQAPGEYCEEYGYCIDTRFEFCPTPCEEPTPYRCNVLGGECVENEAICADACKNDDVFCPAYGQCIQPEYGQTCPVPECIDPALPFSCQPLGQCTADEASCAAVCVFAEYPFCPAYNLCHAGACPQACEPDAPFFCPVIDDCVLDQGACDIFCDIGYAYCAAVGGCYPADQCFFGGEGEGER